MPTAGGKCHSPWARFHGGQANQSGSDFVQSAVGRHRRASTMRSDSDDHSLVNLVITNSRPYDLKIEGLSAAEGPQRRE